MNEPIEVVFSGIGGYGAHLVASLMHLQEEFDCRIVGAADPHPQGSRVLDELEKRDVPLYADIEDFYREAEADLAVIASPIQFHVPQTCLALSHGSHVYCEKPLTATVQDGRRMIAARDEAQKLVAIGYQWSYSPTIQDLKRDIRSGLFGAPKRCKTVVLWPRKEAYFRRNNWAGRRKDPEGRWVLDSVINNATAHYLHNIFFCLGDAANTSARPVEVTGEIYRAKDIENFDTGALRARTAEGVEVLYYASHSVTNGIGPLISFEFEDATVISEPGHAPFMAHFEDGSTKDYPEPAAGGRDKLRNMLNAVLGREDLLCTPEAALSHTVCVNGLHDSAGDPVDFPTGRVRVQGERAERLTWVEGLQEEMLACYRNNVLPSEMGLDWACGGRTVDLRDYGEFPGGGRIIEPAGTAAE